MRANTRDARRRTPVHPTRLAAAALVAVAALAAPMTAATTASAHSALVSTDPAEGATLDAPPSQITLTFNEDVLDMGTDVFVVDAAGTDHAGEPVIGGATVTVPIDGTLPGGAIEVRWRVVSGDGHPISGVLPFTVAGAAPTASASATEAAPAGEAPASEAAGDDATTGDGTAADDASAADDAPADDSGVPRTLLVGLAGAAVALLVLAVVLVVRRTRARARAATQD